MSPVNVVSIISKIGLRIRRSIKVDQINIIDDKIKAKIIPIKPSALVDAVPKPKLANAVPLIPLVPIDANAPSINDGIPI